MDSIRGTALLQVGDLLGERGASLRSFLTPHNIPFDVVGDFDKRFSYRSLAQIYQGTAQAVVMPYFGMELATRQGLNLMGPLRYLARSAATVGEGLDLVLRYMNVYSPSITYRLERRSACRSAWLYFENILPSTLEVPQIVEKSLMHGVMLLTELLGGVHRPRAVLFRHGQQASMAHYHQYFGCPVRFGQDVNVLVMNLDDLEKPSIHHDPMLQSIVHYYLESQYDSSSTLQSEVIRLMRMLLPQYRCNLEQVSLALGVSPRTLQRHLAQVGLDFERQLDQLRCQLARQLLTDSALSISQISRELGYRSATSFCRAHNRWFGMAPQEYRNELHRTRV